MGNCQAVALGGARRNNPIHWELDAYGVPFMAPLHELFYQEGEQ